MEKSKSVNRITRHTINLTNKNKNENETENHLNKHFYNIKVEIYSDKTVRLIRYKNDRVKSGHLQSKSNKIDRDPIKELLENNDSSKENYLFSVRRKIQQYARNNDFKYFVTLTFDPKKIESDSDNYRFDKLKEWLHKERRKARYRAKEFKYIFVPEYHQKGTIHFHGLIGGNYIPGLIRANTKRENYNFKSWVHGFSMVCEIRSKKRVSTYISKYITKELINSPVAKNKKRYWSSKNLTLPEVKYLNLSNLSNLDLSIYESLFDSEICEIYELDKKFLKELD